MIYQIPIGGIERLPDTVKIRVSVRPLGGMINLLRQTRRARYKEARQHVSKLNSHQILFSAWSEKHYHRPGKKVESDRQP